MIYEIMKYCVINLSCITVPREGQVTSQLHSNAWECFFIFVYVNSCHWLILPLCIIIALFIRGKNHTWQPYGSEIVLYIIWYLFQALWMYCKDESALSIFMLFCSDIFSYASYQYTYLLWVIGKVGDDILSISQSVIYLVFLWSHLYELIKCI